MKRTLNTILVLVVLLVFGNSDSSAKVKLPAFFASNMVLQQQSCVGIWGSAEANSEVWIKTSWNNNEYTVESDSKGKWRTTIETPQAGGPYNIQISDGDILTLENILIGEVWFCSGQSNMMMKVSGNYNQPVFGSLDEIVKSENKEIRFFPVKVNGSSELSDNVEGNWLECNSSTTANFSAVAYFFGKMLNEVLGVPVGLIRSCMGGTPIETWMSRDPLKEFDFVNLKDFNTVWDIKSKDPTMYYNAMIHPFLGFGIKGVLWYQGESNARRPDEYAKLFPAMIENWRNNWEIGQFPFYYAQIAPHYYPHNINSAYLREIQLKTAEIVPNVGMASLMDIGQKEFVHPGEKKAVGKRLAYIALSKSYGMKGFECFGPTLKEMVISADTVKLSFNHASNGLTTFGKKLTNFKIAGRDKIFYPADGKITRNEGLVLTSNKVPNPVAVRYAFESFAIGELYNTFGLPASSFRTDDWDE